MCLAKVYLKEKGEKELLLDSVALVEIGEKQIRLSTIFGEQREVEANVKEIDFEKSSIILEGVN